MANTGHYYFSKMTNSSNNFVNFDNQTSSTHSRNAANEANYETNWHRNYPNLAGSSSINYSSDCSN